MTTEMTQPTAGPTLSQVTATVEPSVAARTAFSGVSESSSATIARTDG